MEREGHPEVAISVVIPAIDEAERIAGAVASAVAIGARQVLVVDGGSRDDTVARARAAGAGVVVAPRGRARQLRAGLAAAEGTVVLFLHSDTSLPAEAASAIRRLLAKPGTVGGAFPLRFAERGWKLRVIEAGIRLRSRLGWAATGDQAQWFRRDVLLAQGGVPDVPFLEDLILWKRLGRAGRLRIARTPVVTSARRFLERGPFRTMLWMWSVRLRHRLGAPPEKLMPVGPPAVRDQRRPC